MAFHEAVGDHSEGSRLHSEHIFPVLSRLRRAVWVFDIDRSRVHWANAAALDLWQSESLDELRARDMSSDMSPEVATRLRQYQADFLADADTSFAELWTLYPHGTPRTLQVEFSAFELDDGRMATMLEALHDYELAPDGLRSSEALLHTSVMISMYTPDGKALYRNPAARASLQSSLEHFEDRFVDDGDYQRVAETLTSRGMAAITACVHTSIGERWHEISGRRCHDAVTGSTAWLISEVDVSGLKDTEERARYLAGHDSLTGLPNRHYLIQSFSERLADIDARREKGAVIFIDLDHFKNINDTLGHAAGDRLLMVAAWRLRNIVRKSDLVARLGGDEFLVLASDENIIAHVNDLASRIADSMSQPVSLNGRDARVTPTLGVSLYPDDGRDMETLMRHADLAVYRAKDQGRNKMVYFTPEMNAAVQSRVSLEAAIREGLRRGEFHVHYQPRVCVHSNAIVGAEALARWDHPARGPVPPDEFIPICEETGLIQELGDLVLRQVAQQQRAWRDAGHNLLVSVNLSALQIASPEFVENVCGIVADAGGDPGKLELEITESMLVGHDESTIARLQALADKGFRISIDDFGTGYSNLAYLHRFRLDCLKIDRSFIHELDEASPIAEMIVAMARLLKLDIVAEGVEHASQLEWLRGQSCQEYQGFHFSRAVPAAELLGLLRENQAAVAEPSAQEPLHEARPALHC